MPLSLNVPTSVSSAPGTYSAKYLATGSSSGVFIDINLVSFSSDPAAHPGIAFFCNGVPAGAPDGPNAWTGTACGVIFRPDGSIQRESWLGGPSNFVVGAPTAPGTWQYGVIYRVTASWNGGNVILAVYKTDNNGNLVRQVFGEVVPTTQTVVDDDGPANNNQPPNGWSYGSRGRVGTFTTKLSTKGTHAAVFSALGGKVGTCPIALYA